MNGAEGSVRSPARARAASTISSSGAVTPRAEARKSPWRHSVPLGMPVVPPV
jgi:hypothetical protein